MLKPLLLSLVAAAMLFAAPLGCASDEPATQPTAAPAAPPQLIYPPPCPKMRSCVTALGNTNPAARADYESGWTNVEDTLRRGDSKSAAMACARALRAYAARPAAPGACR